MSKILRLTVLFFLALGGSLSACNLETPECVDMPAPFFISVTRLDENMWYLTPGETEKPLYLKWGYPISDCMPDRFRIIINDIPLLETVPLLTDVVSPPGEVSNDSFDGRVETPYMLYTMQTPITFRNGTYWYWVIPMSGNWFRGERGGPFKVHLHRACGHDDPYAPTMTELVYPENGQMIYTLSPLLVWRNTSDQDNGCLGTNFQYILYSQITDDLRVLEYYSPSDLEPSPGAELLYASSGRARSAALNLSECQRTYWKVVFVSPARGEGYAYYMALLSETYYFDVDPSLCEGELPPLFDLPFAIPVAPTAKTVETANCRSGPTTAYPLLSILPAGTEYEIVGRNQVGDAWLLLDQAIASNCWVAANLVEVTGDTSQVPIIEAAPLQPTPTDTSVPFNCSQYTGLTCEVDNHPCKWTGNVCVNE